MTFHERLEPRRHLSAAPAALAGEPVGADAAIVAPLTTPTTATVGSGVKALTTLITGSPAVRVEWPMGKVYQQGIWLDRRLDAGEWQTLNATPLTATASKYLDTTVAPGGTYTYRVRPAGAPAQSVESPTVTVAVVDATPGDDLQAKIHAIPQGGVLRFAAGTYRVTRSLELAGNRTYMGVRGGPGLTAPLLTGRGADGSDVLGFAFMAGIEDGGSVVIEGLDFQGNGLELVRMQSVAVRNCRFIAVPKNRPALGAALWMNEVRHADVRRNSFLACDAPVYAEELYSSGARPSRINANRFIDCPSPIHLVNRRYVAAADLSVSGNRFSGGQRPAIEMQDPDSGTALRFVRPRLVGNHFTGWGRNSGLSYLMSVPLDRSIGMQIRNNYEDGSAELAIELGGRDVTIAGNRFGGGNSVGVTVPFRNTSGAIGFARLKVTGNQFAGPLPVDNPTPGTAAFWVADDNGDGQTKWSQIQSSGNTFAPTPVVPLAPPIAGVYAG